MPQLILGGDPADLIVRLSRDTDFKAVLLTKNGLPWPAGTSLELRITGGPTWTATISAERATLFADKAVVNTVLDMPGVKKANLFSVNGTDDDLWATGRVEQR